MNYLLGISCNRSIVIYASFMTMNSAILRLPYKSGNRGLEISKFLSSIESVKLMDGLRKFVRIKDIHLFSGGQKLYFAGFYLLLKGYRCPAYLIYNLNTVKNLLRNLSINKKIFG